jgi:hypothetical protein
LHSQICCQGAKVINILYLTPSVPLSRERGG